VVPRGIEGEGRREGGRKDWLSTICFDEKSRVAKQTLRCLFSQAHLLLISCRPRKNGKRRRKKKAELSEEDEEPSDGRLLLADSLRPFSSAAWRLHKIEAVSVKEEEREGEKITGKG